MLARSDFVLHGSADDIALYSVNGVPLFFQQGKDSPLYPTLRLLQQCESSVSLFMLLDVTNRCNPSDPLILPKVQVDRGAIRFLLAGANMMCPGMTSPGGWLPSDDQPYATKTPVAIFAEGKQHPAAIGITQMSTTDMRKVNKGIGVETVTYLGDELWNVR